MRGLSWTLTYALASAGATRRARPRPFARRRPVGAGGISYTVPTSSAPSRRPAAWISS